MNNQQNLISRKPPVATTGILGWLRMNLFSNLIFNRSLFFLFKKLKLDFNASNLSKDIFFV